MKNIKVAFPLTVPKSDYCWDYEKSMCTHFDYSLGYPMCKFFKLHLVVTIRGFIKLNKCKCLKLLK